MELVKAGRGYQLDADRARPAVSVRLRGRNALRLRHEYREGGGVRQRQRTVLDTFTLRRSHRTLELNPTEIDRLRAILERVMLGKTDVKELLRNRPKPAAPSRKARIEARVSFDSAASNTATLIQIVAQDRPGLLVRPGVSDFDNGCNIEVVLIDTEAHKAIDVFYVTSGGNKVTEETQRELEQELCAACQ